MSDLLSPDMTISLMNIAENDAQQKAGQLKKAKHNFERIAETSGGASDPVQVAAQDFEAVFIAEMMKPMFADISTEAPFGGGKGEEVFRGMLLQEYGKIISKTGSIGMSDHIKTEMIRMQAKVDLGSDVIEEHENGEFKGMEPIEVEFRETKTPQDSNTNAQKGADSDATRSLTADDK